MHRRALFIAATSGALGVAPVVVPAQTPQDPFPAPLTANSGTVRVGFVNFATLPDVAGVPARMMRIVDEPGTKHLFVNDQQGPLYRVSYDGKTVQLFVDLSDSKWNVGVQSQGRERGVQSFAFHPQYGQRGTPGFGKFYTWSDVSDTGPTADFLPKGGGDTHDTVLHEWTARTPDAAAYDGGPPRELMRFQQPYGNHNGGMIGFNSTAAPGSPDFGLLYIGNGDGGSGGDPNGHAQDLMNGFGKVLRIDPLGRNSRNGKYGIPSSNPFVRNGASALPEIFAYGVRNPQQFAWDKKNGRMFLTDIGQNIVEELDTLSAGANLGWNTWEGSFGFGSRAASLDNQRGDSKMTFPIAEYAQSDPLLQNQSAASGLVVYRGTEIPALANGVLWCDLPSGEMFFVSADALPSGGQNVLRRILLNNGGKEQNILEVIRDRNAGMGKDAPRRVDLRIGEGPNGDVYLLNKADGVIRKLAR